jgi:L-alanine-DL-glutamate epimerase-like enolase superfamily enzyme
VPDDPIGHARVLREGGLPIAAGENLRSVWEFRQLIAAGGVSYPEPDVTNCGGVTAFMKIAHLAEAFNLPVVSHLAPEIHVHLVSAVPNGLTVEYMPWSSRLFKEVVQPVNGQLTVPQKPGLGLEFDPQMVKFS